MTEKYGNLHSTKIHNKLSKCKPGLDLLFLVGFQISNDNKRLIWTHTRSNFLSIANLCDSLQSMKGKELISNNPNSNTHENITTMFQNLAIQSSFANDEEIISIDPQTNVFPKFYVLCRCNRKMQFRMTENIACDLCGKQRTMWHCQNTSAHINGYHLCLVCVYANNHMMTSKPNSV